MPLPADNYQPSLILERAALETGLYLQAKEVSLSLASIRARRLSQGQRISRGFTLAPSSTNAKTQLVV